MVCKLLDHLRHLLAFKHFFFEAIQISDSAVDHAYERQIRRDMILFTYSFLIEITIDSRSNQALSVNKFSFRFNVVKSCLTDTNCIRNNLT